jgi:hypothetical protein
VWGAVAKEKQLLLIYHIHGVANDPVDPEGENEIAVCGGGWDVRDQSDCSDSSRDVRIGFRKRGNLL